MWGIAAEDAKGSSAGDTSIPGSDAADDGFESWLAIFAEGLISDDTIRTRGSSAAIRIDGERLICGAGAAGRAAVAGGFDVAGGVTSII